MAQKGQELLLAVTGWAVHGQAGRRLVFLLSPGPRLPDALPPVAKGSQGDPRCHHFRQPEGRTSNEERDGPCAWDSPSRGQTSAHPLWPGQNFITKPGMAARESGRHGLASNEGDSLDLGEQRAGFGTRPRPHHKLGPLAEEAEKMGAQGGGRAWPQGGSAPLSP